MLKSRSGIIASCATMVSGAERRSARNLALRLAASGFVLALLAVAPAVHAQETARAPGVDGADVSGFSDSSIIVMARRRAEALEDVPQTVTVATGELLDKLQIEDLTDIDKV